MVQDGCWTGRGETGAQGGEEAGGGEGEGEGEVEVETEVEASAATLQSTRGNGGGGEIARGGCCATDACECQIWDWITSRSQMQRLQDHCSKAHFRTVC